MEKGLRHPIQIRPQLLSREGFQPYGEALLLPETPAPKRGENWDCWNRLARLGRADFQAGFVRTRPSQQAITVMERHPQVEMLIPVSAALIQLMGPPGDISDPTSQPDAHLAAAFIIQPGQAIIMAPGAWHWAALPYAVEEASYYYLTEPSPSQDNFGSWIPFRGDQQVSLLIGD